MDKDPVSLKSQEEPPKMSSVEPLVEGELGGVEEKYVVKESVDLKDSISVKESCAEGTSSTTTIDSVCDSQDSLMFVTSERSTRNLEAPRPGISVIASTAEAEASLHAEPHQYNDVGVVSDTAPLSDSAIMENSSSEAYIGDQSMSGEEVIVTNEVNIVQKYEEYSGEEADVGAEADPVDEAEMRVVYYQDGSEIDDQVECKYETRGDCDSVMEENNDNGANDDLVMHELSEVTGDSYSCPQSEVDPSEVVTQHEVVTGEADLSTEVQVGSENSQVEVLEQVESDAKVNDFENEEHVNKVSINSIQNSTVLASDAFSLQNETGQSNSDLNEEETTNVERAVTGQNECELSAECEKDENGDGDVEDDGEGEEFAEEEEFEEGDEVEVEIEDCSDPEMEAEGGVTYIISEGMIVVEENEASEVFQSDEDGGLTEEEHIVCDEDGNVQKTTRIVIKVPSSKAPLEAGSTNDPSLSEDVQIDLQSTEMPPASNSETESPVEAASADRHRQVTQQPSLIGSSTEEVIACDADISKENADVHEKNCVIDQGTSGNADHIPVVHKSVEKEEVVGVQLEIAPKCSSEDIEHISADSKNLSKGDAICVSLESAPKEDNSEELLVSVDSGHKHISDLNRGAPEKTKASSASKEAVSQPKTVKPSKSVKITQGSNKSNEKFHELKKISSVAPEKSKLREKTPSKISPSPKLEMVSFKEVSPSKGHHKSQMESVKERRLSSGHDVPKYSSKSADIATSHKQKSHTKAPTEGRHSSSVKSSSKTDIVLSEGRASRTDSNMKHADAKATVESDNQNDNHNSKKVASQSKHPAAGSPRTRSNSTSNKESSHPKNSSIKEKRSSRKDDGTKQLHPESTSSNKKAVEEPKVALRSSRSRKSQSDSSATLHSHEPANVKKEKTKPVVEPPPRPRQSERVSKATEKAIASGMVPRRSRGTVGDGASSSNTECSDLQEQAGSSRKSKRKADLSPSTSKEDTQSGKRRSTRSGDAQPSEESSPTVTQTLRSVRKGKSLKRKNSSGDLPSVKKVHIDEVSPKEREFIENISKMCRICGSNNDQLLNVFGPEGRTMQLAEKVHSILPIKMREDEPLPTGVCHSCVVTLIACEKLVEKCSSIDNRLRAHFNCPLEKLGDKVVSKLESSSTVTSVKADKGENSAPLVAPVLQKPGQTTSSEDNASASRSGHATRSSSRVSAKSKKHDNSSKSTEDSTSQPAAACKPTAPRLERDDSPPVLEVEPPQSHVEETNQEPSSQPPILDPQPHKTAQQDAVSGEDPANANKRFGNTYRARMKPGQWEKIEKGLEAIHGELSDGEQEAACPEGKSVGSVHTEEFHIVDLDMNVEEVPNAEVAQNTADNTSSNAPEEFHIDIPADTVSEETVQQSSPKSVIDSILVDWSGDEEDVTLTPVQKTGSVGAKGSKGSVNGSTQCSQAPAPTKAKPVSVKQESFWPEPAPGTSTTSTSEMGQGDVPWKCFVCGKRGKSLSKFLEHKKLHLNDRKLVSCPKCSESFSNMGLLKSHMKAHHGDDDEDYVVVQQPKTTRQKLVETVVDVDLTPATDGLFHCSSCQSAFTTIESLCQHKLIHQKISDDAFKCSTCSKSFLNQKELNAHISTHLIPSSSINLFQCAKCDMKMTNQKDFIVHIESHTSAAPSFTCDQCNKIFDTKHKLRSHRSTVHKSTAYACHLCDKVCQKRITLIEHLRKHSGDNPFACPVCNKKFNRLANYKAHMTIHENARRYECPYCGKRFNRQSIQQRHIKTHTSERSRRHRCRVCNLTFGLATEMFTHRKLHTRDEVERATWEDEKQRLALTSFPCKVCKTAFNTVEEVLNHMPSHTDDERDIAAKLKNPQLVCDICGKILNSKRTFNAHRSSHIDGKPYVCKVCSKGYSTSTGLNYHMLSHTGERPFPCSFCHKGYKNSTDLKVHMRQHTGEFPYKCNKCNKAFRSTSSLQKHGYVHTEIRPHKCQYCNLGFKRENTKNNHERIHTNDRRFKCKVCSKQFVQKGACEAHEKLHFRGGVLVYSTDPEASTSLKTLDQSGLLQTVSTSASSKSEKHDLFEDFDEEEFEDDDDDDDDEDEYIIYEDKDGVDDDEGEEDMETIAEDQKFHSENVSNLTKSAFEESVRSSNGVDLPGASLTPVPVTLSTDAVSSIGDHSVHITIL